MICSGAKKKKKSFQTKQPTFRNEGGAITFHLDTNINKNTENNKVVMSGRGFEVWETLCVCLVVHDGKE